MIILSLLLMSAAPAPYADAPVNDVAYAAQTSAAPSSEPVKQKASDSKDNTASYGGAAGVAHKRKPTLIFGAIFSALSSSILF